jgi:hypothetical protein
MRKIPLAALIVLLSAAVAQAAQWEKKGDFYFLSKSTRDNFSAAAAGANKFASKYLTFEGVDFLVRGADGWKDYGRLDLEGNTMFLLPIGPGKKVAELHFLAGGNVGNSYGGDELLRVYGDNYYYGVITVIFAYTDGSCKALSVPVFWDWFHLIPVAWSKDGARVMYLGDNPVRTDCSLFHLSFLNPRLAQPLEKILITDSWLSDHPFSEIFAVTLKSTDALESEPKTDLRFRAPASSADNEPADSGTQWLFDAGLDGWVAGCSASWDADAYWQSGGFGRKGVVFIPACNWSGEKYSWIEKKVKLPGRETITLQFLRHSAAFSERDKQWSDGLLKVIVREPSGQETVYEKLYSGEWSTETADLSRFRGRTVIIRFENHGAGVVHLGGASSPSCDGEDAVIDEIKLIQGR